MLQNETILTYQLAKGVKKFILKSHVVIELMKKCAICTD